MVKEFTQKNHLPAWIDGREMNVEIGGFEKFVDDLASTMTVDFALSDDRLDILRDRSGDFCDTVDTWLSMVNENLKAQFEIRGNILLNSGKKLEIVPGFTKRAKDLETKCSRSSKLYSLALAEAKLRLVESMAIDIYPLLENEICGCHHYIEELKNNLLNDNFFFEKLKTESISKVWSLSLPKRMIVPAVTMAIMATVVLSGCVSATEASSGSSRVNYEQISMNSNNKEKLTKDCTDEIPNFNDSSEVVVSSSGKFALVTGGRAVTKWFNYDTCVRTADGGEINILLEYKGGKPIGAIGWHYEGSDPNSHDDGDRSDTLVAASKYFPMFDEKSTVTASGGKYAIVSRGRVVSKWLDLGDIILTADGGEINILLEYKGGKPIGAIGWHYEGNDPNSHDDGDRSDNFEFVKP